MIEIDDDGVPIADFSSDARIDELADYLVDDCARRGIRIDRDVLRAKLERFKGVYWSESRKQLVRLVDGETVGDWKRVEVQPFLSVVH